MNIEQVALFRRFLGLELELRGHLEERLRRAPQLRGSQEDRGRDELDASEALAVGDRDAERGRPGR